MTAMESFMAFTLAASLPTATSGLGTVLILLQFIPQGAALVSWTFGLVAVHVALGVAWSGILIPLTWPLGTLLQRSVVIRWIDRAMGGLFLCFAARLALSRR